MTDEQKEIVEDFFKNIKKIEYGSIVLEIKIHAGKYAKVVYSITENTQKEVRSNLRGITI